MLVDPAFLFKIGTEIVIDTCCATFAEVQKRGEEFWSEFELYAADMLVGVVVNVALVGMLAPYARFGGGSASGLLGRVRHAYGALPSSVFEAERRGYRFSIQQRLGTYFFKGILYGTVGFFCGLVGKGIANLIMTAKRSVKKSEDDVPVPPLVKTSALWGAFLAVSSNSRYQIINGLERLVEASPVAKRVGFTSCQSVSHLFLWHSLLACALQIMFMEECSLWIGPDGVVVNEVLAFMLFMICSYHSQRCCCMWSGVCHTLKLVEFAPSQVKDVVSLSITAWLHISK